MQTTFALLMSFPMSALLIAVAYFVVEVSPLVFASAVAIQRRSTMSRKLLFVGTVSVITYGVFLLLFAVVCVPVGAFLIYLVPALKELGYFQNSYALVIADFIYQWWWLVLPPALAAVAMMVTRYLGKRWNGIVNALQR